MVDKASNELLIWFIDIVQRTKIIIWRGKILFFRLMTWTTSARFWVSNLKNKNIIDFNDGKKKWFEKYDKQYQYVWVFIITFSYFSAIHVSWLPDFIGKETREICNRLMGKTPSNSRLCLEILPLEVG